MHSAVRDLTSLQIEHAASTLRNAGAVDVGLFERKLLQNAPNHAQVNNHLSEARVALMFLDHGANVTMRDSPDLRIEWLDETFYVEVKHFRRTDQDDRDEAAMRSAPGEFVEVGDPSRYKEISNVARKKKPQFVGEALNILVVDSSSDAILPADAMVRSAAREYDDEVLKTPHDLALRRLNGIMLITSWGSVGWNSPNVAFAMTEYALVMPMTTSLFRALDGIGRG